MFKLFDFKFLILLGLTLVVYFMYKEIDYQKERIQQCENQLKTLLEINPNQFHNEETPKLDNKECKPPRPPLQYPKKTNELFEKQTPKQKIQPSKKSDVKPDVKSEVKSDVKSDIKNDNNLNLKLPNKMIVEKIKSSSNTESEKIEKESESESESENKHLEIYSNDNEILMDTTISDSLINKNANIKVPSSETSESQTESAVENINKISYSEEDNIENIKDKDSPNNNSKTEESVSEELENKDSENKDSVSEDSENKDSVSEDSENKDSENKDSENKDSENKDSENKESVSEDSENKDSENKESVSENLENEDLKSKKSVESKMENTVSKKISKNSEKSKSSKEELDELLKDLKIEMDNIKPAKVDLQSLLKMKVPELHNLALKENISLEKKVNGSSKKKTKQELAEEILEKKISN